MNDMYTYSSIRIQGEIRIEDANSWQSMPINLVFTALPAMWLEITFRSQLLLLCAAREDCPTCSEAAPPIKRKLALIPEPLLLLCGMRGFLPVQMESIPILKSNTLAFNLFHTWHYWSLREMVVMQ